MQIQQSQNHYLLQVQKLMSSDVMSTFWSHNMDLLVIVTVDNLLELYRINFKAQKVFQIQQDKIITSVVFSPDSQFIAYGMNDGETHVLKTENGEKLLTVNQPINEEIRSFNFVEYGSYEVNKIFPFKKSTLIEKLILPISPHKNCNKSSIIKINYFNELQNDHIFTLLLSSLQKHTVLHLNGFVTIGQISYDKIAAKHFPSVDYSVHYSHLNPITNTLQAVIVNCIPQKYQIHHIEFQNTILKDMQTDIIKFNCLLSYVTEIIAYVENAYPAVQVYLRDILRQYNSKMNLIDDPDQENINPCTQLFRFLNCGMTSTALINFLTKQIYDTKVLQKLDQTLNAIFNNLHDLILQSIQNSLQRAYLLVVEIRNLCSLEKYKIFNVHETDLVRICQQIQKLYTMGEILLVESTQAKFDIRNLLVWLNKAAIKTSTDPNTEIQNTKSYLSRYTVDFNRLHRFLQSEQTFKLHNLTSFFSKGNQSFHMRIPDCEFRLLKDLNKKQKKESFEFISKTKQIEKLLQVDDIDIVEDNHQMDIELSYRSFKMEMKMLKDEWKQIKIKPVIEVSKKIEESYKINKIGEVQMSEMFELQISPLFKKSQNTNEPSQLLLYFIEHKNSQRDILVQYSTLTHTRKTISLPSSCQAQSLSIGMDLILLTQNPESMQQQKSIIQILNTEWKGQQIEIGKRIDKLNGEIIINAGLRGLNCFVINKNKLVVFD